MESDTNTLASVALFTGIGAVVVFLLSFCVSFVPFVNLLGFLLFPVLLILELTAVVTGMLGMRKATGRGKAIAGLLMGGAILLFQVAMMALGIGLAGLAGLLSIIANS